MLSPSRILYRFYRSIKAYLIRYEPPIVTSIFFNLLPLLEKLVSPRRTDGTEEEKVIQFRSWYGRTFSFQSPPFFLKTSYLVAITSDDHLSPHGSICDNSENFRFNKKLYELLGYPQSLILLDVGCSGGAFVRSILEDGYAAIGLEGSNISQTLKSGEWGLIPLHLFTCDATKPFHIENPDGRPILFDVITAWEFLEHIEKKDLPSLILNIFSNLRSGGYFIASVATFPDANPCNGAVYHKTLESREWWLHQFLLNGFEETLQHPFLTSDWVRGNGCGFTNWSPDNGDGFHLVLRKTAQ